MIRFIKNLFDGIFSFIGGLFSTGKKKTDQLTLSVKESQLASSITDGQLVSSVKESSGQALEKAKQLAAPITENSGQTLEKTKQLASAAVGSSGQALEQALGKDKQAQTKTAQSNGKATKTLEKPVDTKQSAKASTKPKADKKQSAKAEAAKTNGSQPATSEALNMPKPKVTQSFSDFSSSNFETFGDRRYPGSNMQAFLKMARQMKPAK